MQDDTTYFSYTKSPYGDILLARTKRGLTRINFQAGKNPVAPLASWRRDEDALLNARDQLHAYFYGERTTFDLPLAPEGTDFQRRVWKALQKIPCGHTLSYADLARRIGNANAVRAVASANASNPLPVVIPCHRVIGSDGKLKGYAGGLRIKEGLLAHEGAILHGSLTA